MTNHGDDCYFYFYSTCTKGDSCPFRHCEAAMGSETVCNLWQENCCFRKICKFRHMEIKKKRSEIPCYWENQPAGCQKPHCAFHHEKPRFIDGIYVPPSKVPIIRKEGEEEALLIDPLPPAPAPIANPANPQIRGVIKTETLENVPSPTHPPVVINTVDDEDEDEDDQFSEEGDDHKTGSDALRIVSSRKLSNNQDDSLNFGIKTLEEIRLRKALKANLKKSGQLSVQACSNNGTSVEKENIRASLTSVILTAKEDCQLLTENPPKRQIGDRLGKRKVSPGDQLVSASRAQKSVRNRLGLPVESACSETDSTDVKLAGEIRIKTLDEIKQEKASRLQERARTGNICTTAKPPGPLKRPSKVLASPDIRKCSEVFRAKKELEAKKMISDSEASLSEKKEILMDMGLQGQGSAKMEEVRVKTLDEIRREKAARMQAKVQDAQTEKQPSIDKGFPKRRILHINKPMATDAVKINEQKTRASMEQSTRTVDAKMTATNGSVCSSGENVNVKSFEEIMREKKLRKQQMEQVDSSLQSQHSSVFAQEQAIQKGKSLIAARPGGSSIQLSPESSTQPKALFGGGKQRIALKQKESAPVPPAEQNIVVSTSLEKQVDPPSTSPINFISSSRKRSPPVSLPAHNLVPVEAEVVLKKSAGQLPEPKVRPKLNVKPSIMKLAKQVQLTQKRREPESPRSAVAAVKPLNSTAVEIKSREPSCNRPAMSASTGTLDTSVQGSSQVLKSLVMEYSMQGPGDLVLDLESSRLQPQVVSITDQRGTTYEPVVSPTKETSKSTFAISKTPNHGKARRLSTVSARASSSAVDDFDELMNEFTDDRLEDEMELDPGKGEDDLLLELSEMIDS
ncbi:zinc finger CCCH domain-containing protein 11A isoform X1 [Brienomyrus brachyistius]|uniref:zinc finger CCCH domain-containing protein 11A isoform X1 n=1 Tax=Brienomyrus brachyistius TaxID=42636 RepID=UPI0020B24953|nr:zinc finger CCCH domain-containing protein 11A isoform X1 [Brienomyrus brachyistius]XP_048878477.1 zinc finger CCCH domain-containing protein 11A isoform X1 [Brienomyrus brachyistius]XP_048878478.1 zinc finger CCCH domain-containing protein 11A isoform X1 [Brienomyrus brachyistius]XP_048878479.1 zinc finger CCCH domain-containing protein 11A isoform X1 [Brienomyrus brachyistius]XP_048878480.1 zinc finger CCCH domain-containing protein 11A isoform X1 [Brienomyrus brachyistius]XP_048878481.1 